MKQLLIASLLALMPLMTTAQSERPFEGELSNDELKVTLRLNLYDKDIIVPGQEIYGELDGYLRSSQCAHVWVITVSKVVSPTEAKITFINNYGSEDLTARLIALSDGSLEYHFIDGSTLKFPVNGKWQKLPKTFRLKRM